MSPSSGSSKIDTRAWIQELKSNPKTQAALGALVLVLTWLLWPDPPKARPKASPRNPLSAPIHGPSPQGLDKLPDLAALDQAGELPSDAQMKRDLFLFEAPRPPEPPKKVIPPPPPKPPTPEELKAAQLKAARESEKSAAPKQLRYLGFMESRSSGRIGAFMRGEEPLSLRVGDQPAPRWKLMAITETYAEFQNLTYPDLRHRVQAAEGSSQPHQAPSNQF